VGRAHLGRDIFSEGIAPWKLSGGIAGDEKFADEDIRQPQIDRGSSSIPLRFRGILGRSKLRFAGICITKSESGNEERSEARAEETNWVIYGYIWLLSLFHF
jgi:hypothetical protein